MCVSKGPLQPTLPCTSFSDWPARESVRALRLADEALQLTRAVLNRRRRAAVMGALAAELMR